MDKCRSAEELDRWASERGLMNDDLVSLRRIQLMADSITNQQDDKTCAVCEEEPTAA